MNPKRIALCILIVLLSLLGLTFVSQPYTNKDNKTVEGIGFGDFRLKYPTFSTLSKQEEKVTNTKAQAIAQQSEEPAPTQEQEKNEEPKYQPLKFPKKEKALKDSLYAYLQKGNPPLVSNQEGKIYYPDTPEDFVRKLHQKFSKKNCRIIHFGDSKIEGDRITSYLRNWLQVVYGGSGPGYFPIKMPYNQHSVQESTGGEWFRYALFNAEQRKRKELLSHNQYGLYANVCRFTPAQGEENSALKTASFTVKPSKHPFARLGKYSVLGIHYGNCTHPTSMKIFQKEKLLKEVNLITDGKYHHYKMNFTATPAELRIEFSSEQSPDFYGITLDSPTGIHMDNVPTRGDSGTYFTKIGSTFGAMSAELSPEFFIFEYGGNMVPALTENTVKANVKRIINNMNWVKRRNPKALFLLIGPSDMLERQTQLSYSILPALTQEMRTQALENGFAFWSMYEAMGGENAMNVWHENGLGSHDFTHFTSKGTERISELLFEELLNNLLSVQNPDLYKP